MTDKQLAKFRKSRIGTIGGTTTAAILGIHPWKTKLDAYLECVGLRESNADNPFTSFGITMEPHVAANYVRLRQEELGRPVHISPMKTIRHPQYRFMTGNPDRKTDAEGEGLLEVKTYGYNTSHEWGVPGSDQIPRHYFIQGSHYLIISDLPYCDYAAFNREDCITTLYQIQRNERIESEIIEAILRFKADHLDPGILPPATGSEHDTEILERLFPVAHDKSVQASDEIEALTIEMKGLYDLSWPTTDRIDEIKNTVRQFMEDAAIMLTKEHGRFQWTNNKDVDATSYDLICAGIPKLIDFVLARNPRLRRKMKAEFDTLLGIYAGTKPGPRVLRTPFRRKKKS